MPEQFIDGEPPASAANAFLSFRNEGMAEKILQTAFDRYR